MPPKIAPALRTFVPEQWGELDAFAKLCSGTYRFNSRERRALAGVRQHLDKALIFVDLAQRLRPGLDIDRTQLNERGFSHAEHSRAMAAVVEAAVVELYSSVDCVAKVLVAIYGKRSRGLKASTRNLFAGVDSIRGDFPDALKVTIRGAGWFGRLCFLRDELTHLGAGGCNLPDGTDKVRFLLGRLWTERVEHFC
jgi:hypothetical protein